LEEDHPRIISAKFGWEWLSSFRGEEFFLISSPLFSKSQKVPKFELYKHNELFNIYYRIFYELWTFAYFDWLCKLEKRGDEIKKKSFPLKLLCQSQPNFAEMILGWSPFLKKFLFLVMVAILDTRRCWRTQFWKGTTQGSFQQSLVEIGSVVSEVFFILILFVLYFQNYLEIDVKFIAKMCSISRSTYPAILK
jgi:hypothetical protein